MSSFAIYLPIYVLEQVCLAICIYVGVNNQEILLKIPPEELDSRGI